MKLIIKSLSVAVAISVLTACGATKDSGWTPLSADQIDQKSYAIAYSATAQTYQDRVNESYDIQSFMRGADDWYNKKVTLPIEQIRASLLNRMLDHNVYAYYSGVLYASELQFNATRLSPKCWEIAQPASMTQGIYDAMLDLQKNNVRDDEYLTKGAEQMLHLCVEQVESEQHTGKKSSKGSKKTK